MAASSRRVEEGSEGLEHSKGAVTSNSKAQRAPSSRSKETTPG